MDLRDALQLIASSYDRNSPLGYDQPAQVLLDKAATHLGQYAPLGFKVGGSGQKPFRLTFTPWIGFLNLDESTTFQNGIYVVYLFSADLTTVYLSLNQGTERLKRVWKLGTSAQLSHLQENAVSIRGRLDTSYLESTTATILLKHPTGRPKTYEAGNIAAIEYDLSRLPTNETLESDLEFFFSLYQNALQIRNELLLGEDSELFGEDPQHTSIEQLGTAGFRPKSDSDYLVEIEGRQIVKSRRHERLVNLFGLHAKSIGFDISSPHPIDLLLVIKEQSWIVEAKVVYNRNYAEAVRGAVGQLFEYRHFLRNNSSLVALFDQPVGDAYTSLLTSLGISVVWNDAGTWRSQTSDDFIRSLTI